MKTGKTGGRFMKKNIIALAFILIFSAGTLFAQRTITIKMASLVPENTPWGQFLNQIASDWRRITNGEVDVIIFHNGTAGKEEEVLRSLRLNQLQAAVLSTFGLTEIIPEIMTLSCPFLIRDDDELDVVLRETKAELEAKINARGFFTLAWSRVGWVRFFSKAPVFTPDDLKRQKLGSSSEYEKMNQVFKTMGFQMVPFAHGDGLIALNSPMVDAIYSSPVAVGGTQLFALAKNMASINVAPFMGAVVLNQRTWNAIPNRYKPQLIEAARRAEAELDKVVKAFEEDMVKTMGNFGLQVNQITPAQEQLWFNEFGRAMPNLIGPVFDRATYNRIEGILRDHRNSRR
jgi:TRAP-type C4-dicarboxylate transport system substrate-binding protein